jgi:hypothetical protein
MEENSSIETTQQNAINYIPTESERKLLDVLLSPEHRMKSIKELCLIVGINRATYYRAFEKPEFKALYKSMSRELVDQSIAPVLNTFVREALRGSFQHGKVILEMAGLYSEKSTLELTGEVTLTAEDRRQRIADLLQRPALEGVKVPYSVEPEPED